MAEKTVANELTGLEPDITYSRAVVKINNFEKISDYVNEVVGKYGNVLVTAETKKDAVESRKHLKDLQNDLKKAKDEIKKFKNDNFSEVEKQVDDLEKKAAGAWRKVQDQISEINKIEAEKEAEKRRDKLQDYIDEKNKGVSIDTNRIIWGAKWLKDQSYTSIYQEIDSQFDNIVKADQALVIEKSSIEQISKALGLEPEPYLLLVGQEEFTHIQALMDKAFANKKARLVAEEEEKANRKAAIRAQKESEVNKELSGKGPVKQPVKTSVGTVNNVPETTPAPVSEKMVNETVENAEIPPVKTKGIFVSVNKEQYDRLKRFMELENIEHKFFDFEQYQKLAAFASLESNAVNFKKFLEGK